MYFIKANNLLVPSKKFALFGVFDGHESRVFEFPGITRTFFMLRTVMKYTVSLKLTIDYNSH